jgi:hypothetical protein
LFLPVELQAAICSRKQYVQKLFIKTGQEKQGRYCVQFYKDGDWTNVFVDDCLPCNALGKPMFATGQSEDTV